MQSPNNVSDQCILLTADVVSAGEHTCKEHPDTVGGAMLTGLREAIRVFHMLKGEDAFGKAAAALVDKDAVRKRKKVSHTPYTASTGDGRGEAMCKQHAVGLCALRASPGACLH